MSGLLLHPTTEKLIRRIEAHLPQALLLKGESGVGLRTIAKELAAKSLVSVIEPTRTVASMSHLFVISMSKRAPSTRKSKRSSLMAPIA
jgi:hypothetical protein